MPGISRLGVFVLSLVGGGVCEQFSPGGGEGSVEAIRVGHVWEEEGRNVGGLAVAALSSGALCLAVVVMPWFWGGPFCPFRGCSSCSSLS